MGYIRSLVLDFRVSVIRAYARQSRQDACQGLGGSGLLPAWGSLSKNALQGLLGCC